MRARPKARPPTFVSIRCRCGGEVKVSTSTLVSEIARFGFGKLLGLPTQRKPFATHSEPACEAFERLDWERFVHWVATGETGETNAKSETR